MRSSKEKQERELTLEESEKMILKHLKKSVEITEIKNHKKFHPLENTYRFTMSIVSLKFLNSLLRDRNVEDLLFSPSAPPPGGGFDGTSLRYKIYVVYKKKTKG